MAHSRRGFGPVRPQRSKRLTAWDLGPGGDDLATLDAVTFTASTTQILGSGITPAVDRFTIVRLHGILNLRLTAAAAQDDGYNWAAGIGIASLDAFATGGVSSLPDPFTNIGWPGWMWHQQGSLHTVVGALAIGDPSINPVQVAVSSKSMRILRQNEVVFAVIAAGETGVAVLEVTLTTRMLLKLA